LDELGETPKNSFPHTCPCGKISQVSINFRKAHRKEVNLIGSFIVTSDPKNFRRPCTVLDISAAGMRVGTELVKSLQKGDDLLVTFILNDKAKTKLELRCATRQIFPDKKSGLILGLEFINMNPHHLQVLGFYMMT
jgi:c-di-GMP-binding flagellar brake protein YcgR